MTRVQRETVAYLAITAFCILMLTWAIPNYTPPYPGYGASPALVPVVSVGVMLAMSVLALLRGAIIKFKGGASPSEENEEPEKSGFTQAGKVNLVYLASFMIPAALLVVGIEYLGYIPAAFLFMLVIQFVVGARNLLQPIIVSAVAVALMYIVMRYGFGVPVPGPKIF